MSPSSSRYPFIEHYHQLIQQAKQNPFSPQNKDYQTLFMVAIGLGLIAGLGYLAEGYHFAFLTLNALSPYVPSMLLQWITSCGDTTFLLALILILAPRQVQYHWSIFFACIVAGVTINVLKDYFAMPRPPAVLEAGSFFLTGEGYTSRSFPSGHSFTAFVVASISFLYLKPTWMKVAVLVMAALTALSRVLIGVHWTEDVLVGSALGTLMGMFCVWATCRWRIGVSKGLHLVALVILTLVAISVYFTGNDYTGALPLLYLGSGLAVVQVVRSYFFLSK